MAASYSPRSLIRALGRLLLATLAVCSLLIGFLLPFSQVDDGTPRLAGCGGPVFLRALHPPHGLPSVCRSEAITNLEAAGVFIVAGLAFGSWWMFLWRRRCRAKAVALAASPATVALPAVPGPSAAIEALDADGEPAAVPTGRPAGWYADPVGPQRHRWWDGEAWSWYVHADGEVQWDPIAVEEHAPEPPGVRGVGIAVAGYVVGVALGVVITVIMVRLKRPGGQATLLLLSELGLWSGFVGACVLVSRRRGTSSLTQDFGWRFRGIDVVFGLAGSLVARVLSVFAVIPFAWAFQKSSQPSQQVFRKVNTGAYGWAVLIVVTCIGAPIIEELFFRGLVQTRLVGRWGPVAGIGVTSVLFGAAHLIGWQGPVTILYAIAVAAGGVVLGSVRYLTGRLGTSIAVHVFFNTQVIVLLALFG